MQADSLSSFKPINRNFIGESSAAQSILNSLLLWNSTKANTVDSKSSKPVVFEVFEENKDEKSDLIYDSILFETMNEEKFKKLSPRS